MLLVIFGLRMLAITCLTCNVVLAWVVGTGVSREGARHGGWAVARRSDSGGDGPGGVVK